jgi:DNA-binding winged helix-turn-helix (wHTH) protein
MAELRKKIEADPARPKLIITEPGVGYRLRELETTPHVQSQIGEPRCTP